MPLSILATDTLILGCLHPFASNIFRRGRGGSERGFRTKISQGFTGNSETPFGHHGHKFIRKKKLSRQSDVKSFNPYAGGFALK